MPLQNGKKEGLPSNGQYELQAKVVRTSFKNQRCVLESVCVSEERCTDPEDALRSLCS